MDNGDEWVIITVIIIEGEFTHHVQGRSKGLGNYCRREWVYY